MKFITSFFVLFISISSVYGQYDSDKLFYSQKAARYKKMKNTGAILTIGGLIMTIVSINALDNTTTTTTTGSYSSSSSNNGAGAALGFLGGTAAMGAGVPLWIVGAHAERKYTRKLENATLGFNVTKYQTGVTLTYRFPVRSHRRKF